MIRYANDQFLQSINKLFVKKIAQTSVDNVTASTDSFPVCQIEDFFNVDIQSLQDAVAHLKFSEKENDLYKMRQSQDFKLLKRSNKQLEPLCKFYDTLKSSQFCSYLQTLTGIELSQGVLDVACQIYSDTERLLCHDDAIEESNGLGRRLAFVYYLTDLDWTEADGGLLQILARDSSNQPTHNVVQSVVPKRGSLVIFEVSPHSFHQVSEVTSSKDRISISGWFHGPLNCLQNVQLEECVNELYMHPEIASDITSKFCEESVVELQHFFVEDVVQLASEAEPAVTIICGPAHKQKYTLVQDGSIIKDIMDCTDFRMYLEVLTDLMLHAQSNCEWQNFGQGDYTLLHDENVESVSQTLDVVYTLDSMQLSDNCGGDVVYIADEETLLTLDANVRNSLTLVYNDKKVMSFTRYLNHLSGSNKINRFVKRFKIIEHENENL